MTALRFAGEEVVPRLRATTDELDHLLGGLHGRHVPGGAVGLADPRARRRAADRAQLLLGRPQGAAVSDLACDVGRRLADALLRRHLDEDGAYPETVGIVVWGTAAMRTARRRRGRDPRAARRAAASGTPRRAAWSGSSPIPLDELGRPRIDVTVRISGFFRDAFPHLVTLLDDAVTLVAGLDEPAEHNFVRKHVLADRDRLVDELGEDAAWRRATTRIFGGQAGHLRRRASCRSSRPATGATTPTSPRSTRPGAATPTAAGWTASQARDAMREPVRAHRRGGQEPRQPRARHARLDDYFAEHGGMVAYVRHLAGARPARR